MSIEERQQKSPEEALHLWIHWERGPMVVDDIRALPERPIIVAEGTTIPAREDALWLDRPSAWPDNPVFVYFAQAVLENARRHNVPIYSVDGSVDDTIAAIEEHFAELLAAGPRAETAEERRALLREANEALVFQVRTRTARPWAPETPETLTRDFICECGDPECRAVVTIPAAEWERRAQIGPVTS